MEYRIAPSQDYKGHDYWDWSAWIEAEPPAALRQIQRVVWILHPTFKRSRVESTDVDHAFRLDTSGWGTFLLRAELHLSDGSTTTIKHMLELTEPDKQGQAPSKAAASTRPDVKAPNVETLSPVDRTATSCSGARPLSCTK